MAEEIRVLLVEPGEKPVLHVADNEHEEAQFIADKIMENRAKGAPWGDHAVLYRVNALSNRIEYALKRSGIPYRVYGGMKFFDRAEVKDMLAYLSVIANPADDLRFYWPEMLMRTMEGRILWFRLKPGEKPKVIV